MSRKTKPHATRSGRVSVHSHWNVYDMPRVEEPLKLVCGVCGASGRYDVGTITFDPLEAKSSDRDAIERALGFTGCFRCRQCDAGGPWKLPPETFLYVTAMMIAKTTGGEDVPFVLGCTATFDKKIIRYGTDGEAHLKRLIDNDPEDPFLWVRLGNLYSHAGLCDRARPAYERAIELDPTNIEAHGMLGHAFVDTNRLLDSVPHWHAVLKHAREAEHVDKKIRRSLVRRAIECLLDAHAESNGQIDLLPTTDPAELNQGGEDEPLVVELREFDLGCEEGMDELCNVFLQRPRRRERGLFRRPRKRVSEVSAGPLSAPVRREALTVGRNDRCPCGSGHKYKKCCGRSANRAGLAQVDEPRTSVRAD